MKPVMFNLSLSLCVCVCVCVCVQLSVLLARNKGQNHRENQTHICVNKLCSHLKKIKPLKVLKCCFYGNTISVF